MKFFYLLLALGSFCYNLSAQTNPQAVFKKQLKAFTKAAQGLYEVRPEGENIPEAQRQQQDLLMFPVSHWDTNTEAWFCFIWLSPKFKDKPLEQVFIRLKYKSEQEMNANFYTLPKNAEITEGLSQEWKKNRPFEKITTEFLTTESLACEGFIGIDADGTYRMESYEPCPRDTKGAGYTAIQVDTRFYAKSKSTSSGVKFITAEGKVLMEHYHDIKTPKTTNSLKKY